ncbi:MAG TPA: hypothetical protein PKC73_01075 [Dermatophilaceae bacterium]|jgi:hypothetical protein|nr:hypothetical protein [Actinomycetales bacterium]HMT32561.1 hypothetical protein [Dermatophilaceae bacterium]HMT88201.1 hypothetical protein [Dermatophilaceae bacterium]
MTAQMTYQSPTLAPAYDELSIDENEVLPAILWAVASFLGVSASFVAWVCSQCGNRCNSFWNTVSIVRAWFGSGC